MNCPCDELIFPAPLNIAAGLGSLPRQIATFPEFRAAMLAAIPGKGPLVMWRARSTADFGIMLLEMWAYVCDCVSFYDEVCGNEMFVRTAQQRSSLRGLTGLLGYIPRPAVAAVADLAVFVDGRIAMTLPAGTAFRSGAFPGGAPQVFELPAPASVHPFDNQWTIAPNRPPTIDGGKGIPSLSLTYLRLDRKTNKLKKGSIFLFEVIGSPSHTAARTVKAISDFAAQDGATYKKIEWDGPITVPGNTPISSIRLSSPTRVAHLWPKQDMAGDASINNTGGGTFLHFDSVYQGIGLHSQLIVEKNGEVRYFSVTSASTIQVQLVAGTTTTVKDKDGNVTATVTSPDINMDVTDVALGMSINNPARKPPGAADWDGSDAPAVNVHYAFAEVATVVAPAWTTLIQGDPLNLLPPVEKPQNGKSPARFLLEDKDGTGFEPTGGVDFSTGALTLDSATPIPGALQVLVQVYGNVVTVVRGETVPMEVLGAGDATILNQQFKLKKSPLTYTASGAAGNDSGVASSLSVYVDGVLWAEAPTFFGVNDGDQVYIIRQNDDGDSVVTFNGRLATGSLVTATYRFGAGKTSPPAGSIKQLARPVTGLKTVRNPVAAFGGDDAEPASKIRTLAPRSALLLGRAISIPDMQAAALGVPGVRAASAEWNWSKEGQCAVVHVYYIGDGGLQKTIRQRLRSLSDSTTPIRVEVATSVPVTLSISLETDPKRLESNVLPAVRQALMDTDRGLLPPERIGIGLPLFRSQIFETVLSVPGALAVDGLFWNGKAFDPWGVTPGAGKYFDLEKGTLLLNGKAGSGG